MGAARPHRRGGGGSDDGEIGIDFEQLLEEGLVAGSGLSGGRLSSGGRPGAGAGAWARQIVDSSDEEEEAEMLLQLGAGKVGGRGAGAASHYVPM